MIRLGMAGLGRWGRILIESVQVRSGEVSFSAATTGRPANSADYVRAWGIDMCASFADLVARKDVDGVVLATPHSQHHRQILDALAAGKHVLVEKPMVLTLAHAEECYAAAAKARRQLCVAFNRRFPPNAIRLSELVKGGHLGTIQAVESAICGAGAFRYQEGMWRADPKEAPAGGMTAMGIHIIDQLVHLIGPVAKVETRSRQRVVKLPIDDTTVVSLDFASGAIGTLTTLQTTAEIWQVRVYGSEGWAEMRAYDRLIVAKRGAEVTETVWPRIDMERAELEAFARAIAGKAPFPVTRAEALDGVAAFEAIVRSAANGERSEAVVTPKT